MTTVMFRFWENSKCQIKGQLKFWSSLQKNKTFRHFVCSFVFSLQITWQKRATYTPLIWITSRRKISTFVFNDMQILQKSKAEKAKITMMEFCWVRLALGTAFYCLLTTQLHLKIAITIFRKKMKRQKSQCSWNNIEKWGGMISPQSSVCANHITFALVGNSKVTQVTFVVFNCKQKHMLNLSKLPEILLNNELWVTAIWTCAFVYKNCDDGNSSYLRSSPQVICTLHFIFTPISTWHRKTRLRKHG